MEIQKVAKFVEIQLYIQGSKGSKIRGNLLHTYKGQKSSKFRGNLLYTYKGQKVAKFMEIYFMHTMSKKLQNLWKYLF